MALKASRVEEVTNEKPLLKNERYLDPRDAIVNMMSKITRCYAEGMTLLDAIECFPGFPVLPMHPRTRSGSTKSYVICISENDDEICFLCILTRNEVYFPSYANRTWNFTVESDRLPLYEIPKQYPTKARFDESVRVGKRILECAELLESPKSDEPYRWIIARCVDEILQGEIFFDKERYGNDLKWWVGNNPVWVVVMDDVIVPSHDDTICEYETKAVALRSKMYNILQKRYPKALDAMHRLDECFIDVVTHIGEDSLGVDLRPMGEGEKFYVTYHVRR